MREKKLYINIGFVYGRIYVTKETPPDSWGVDLDQIEDIKDIGFFSNTIVKIEKYNSSYCEELSTSTEGIFNKLKELYESSISIRKITKRKKHIH